MLGEFSGRSFQAALICTSFCRHIKGTFTLIANPESFIDDCTRCGRCRDACEMKIIVNGDGGYPTVDFHIDECTFCYQCAEVCPEPIFIPQTNTAWQAKAASTTNAWLSRTSSVEAAEKPATQWQFSFNCKPEKLHSQLSTLMNVLAAARVYRSAPLQPSV